MAAEANTKECPICSSSSIETFIDIQQIPIICNVLWSDRDGAIQASRGDIQLSYCHDCGHIYNRAYDPQELEYNQQYENSLHFSPTFQKYIYDLACQLVVKYNIYRKSIVEIGSGQGDFIRMLCGLGGNSGIGFDPSYAPSLSNRGEGITFIQDYYSEKYASYTADFVCCRQVLEHIYQPSTFLQMLRSIIGKSNETILFFEMPNAEYTIFNLGIWDILYEHYSYFNPTSLACVFARNGFQVLNIEKTFGGQFLTIEASPVEQRMDGAQIDTHQLNTFSQAVSQFASRYHQKITTWQKNLEEIKQGGKKAVIWGAGTKGIIFLNILKTGGIIDYVVDINPRKHGMYISGTGQKIVPPEFLKDYQPNTVIVMNENYIKEIRNQLSALGIFPEVVAA